MATESGMGRGRGGCGTRVSKSSLHTLSSTLHVKRVVRVGITKTVQQNVEPSWHQVFAGLTECGKGSGQH